MCSESSSNIDVSQWLKSVPIAPEYHPSLSEFQDPISYIFKIEKEASKFGICKIVPPLSQLPKKTILANFNSSLLARDPLSGPTFTTRQQQVGFCPRKHRPVRKPVWQSGEKYSLGEFEAKAKSFERFYLRRFGKKVLSSLEIETLYWNATVDKPFSVEYANDMPGSAFSERREGGKKSESVGDSEWNMRGVSRANSSLLKFMKEEIPGVTSPMVYVAMMFSWFAWHVEDHDLHSLNYLHLGASKTWYGVPRDAAVAFEDVIREHGYCGEINPLVTFATLGEKTTVMSPEVLLNAGVPCCRLVQNAGDFVVTFPRAYHSGFSHGFNCGEAANIATPEWLRVAKEAAIRRASMNCPPMVSHFQLLYDLTLSLYSRVPKGIAMEPRSSRLKDKKKSEGEMLIKELFLQDMVQNNERLHVLGKGSSVVLLSQNSISNSIPSNSLLQQQFTAKKKLFPSLCSPSIELMTTKCNSHDDFMVERKQEMEQAINAKNSSCTGNSNTQDMSSEMKKSSEKGLFSCVTCGILCFSCVAVLQPTEEACRNLLSADSSKFDDDWVASDTDRNCNYVSDTNAPNMNPYSVLELLKSQDGLYSVPNSSAHHVTNVDKGSSLGTVSNNRASKDPSSLNLLALAYGDSSDSEAEADIQENNNSINCGSVPSQQFSSFDARDRDSQSLVSSDKFRTDNYTAIESNSLTPHRFRNQNQIQSDTVRFTDEDSSRLHVFCLEHAVQVEKRLSSIGGAHVFLVCHPDYPKLESQAKKVAEELEARVSWNNISFREAIENDEDMIRLALHGENAVHGNGDWAVKLGVNLFYSANLSRSPLYCKQMPYNSIIYKAFGRGLENESVRKVSSRQRKIVVAGKWCGKVWMSNQVHPLLVKKDTEEEEEEQNFGVELGIKPDLVYERRVEGNRAHETGQTSRKRKVGVENGFSMKQSPEMQNGGEICQDFAFSKKCNRERHVKQVKKEFRQVEHLDSSSEEVEHRELRHRELRKTNKGKRGGKRLKGEMESLEEYLKKFPLSNAWKVIIGKNGSRHIKETTPDDEQSNESSEEIQNVKPRKKIRGKQSKDENVDESSEEFQTVKSHKKVRGKQSKDENVDESSEETPLCDTWNQIKIKAKRMKMDTSDKSCRAKKPLENELVDGPSTRLRKRKTNPRKNPVTKSVNVKAVPKQRPKERITKKVVATDSKSAGTGDEEDEYQCDMEGCTMSFGSKNELTAHKRNVCPVKGCGKKFFSHKYLVQHRRVHEDDRPLKCPWKGCKMTFKWAWARTEHIRVHTGARPYVCTQAGCGQTFRFVSDFSRHKRKTGHTPKKSKVKRGG